MEAIDRFLALSYGSGYGYGYGSGYGYGYGSGFGIKSFCGKTVYMIDGVQTLIYSVKGNYARGAILQSDLTLTPCYIARVGNFFAHADTLRQALADAQEKYDESKPLAEKIADFKAKYPSLDSIGTGKDFYRWHHVITGSCTAGRDAFCKGYGVEMGKEYTVAYFLDLVKDAYGKENIRQLRKSYDGKLVEE